MNSMKFADYLSVLLVNGERLEFESVSARISDDGQWLVVVSPSESDAVALVVTEIRTAQIVYTEREN